MAKFKFREFVEEQINKGHLKTVFELVKGDKVFVMGNCCSLTIEDIDYNGEKYGFFIDEYGDKHSLLDINSFVC